MSIPGVKELIQAGIGTSPILSAARIAIQPERTKETVTTAGGLAGGIIDAINAGIKDIKAIFTGG